MFLSVVGGVSIPFQSLEPRHFCFTTVSKPAPSLGNIRKGRWNVNATSMHISVVKSETFLRHVCLGEALLLTWGVLDVVNTFLLF